MRGKSAMPLTDTALRTAKPQAKPVKLSDGGGLFLLVTPAGGKWWRYSYRFESKQKTLSLGTYPDTGLKSAREEHDKARKLLAQGIDPGENRKAIKSAKTERTANSFETVAREWLALRSTKRTPAHAARILRRLEADVFPWLGDKPIADITPLDVLDVCKRVTSRGALDTAHRIKNYCGQAIRYAIQTERAERDPTGDLREALDTVRVQHRAAVTDPKQVAELLRTLDSYQGTFSVQCALKLAPLVFARPGELRAAEWKDIDFNAAEWRYTATKTNTPHIVPLSTQAHAILRELQPLTGHGRYVFPSSRSPRGDRCMSDNAILAALRRMGIAKDVMTGHGFRAMARTILDEVLNVPPHLIEHQLAHAVKDANGRAYNRTSHLPERKKMMQQWADYLDKLKAGAEVIPLHGNKA
jgi:integrase